MAAALGINVSADARIPPPSVAFLGARWVRVVARPDVDLTPWLMECRACGVKVLLVIARESMGDMSYGQAAEFYGNLYGGLIDAVQGGNESDHVSPSSWTMHQTELNDLLFALNTAFSIPIICAGMADGRPEYLDGVDMDLVDAIAVHPYGQRPDDLIDWSETPGNFGNVNHLLDRYAAYGKPLWITEIGVSTREVSPQFQAIYCSAVLAALKRRDDVAVVTWFCHDDAMVPGFGLLDENGSPKPAAAAFIRAAGPMPKPKPEEEVMTFKVGPGVLAKMKDRSDQPATDEIYHPYGAPKSQYSETFGKSGTRYVYIFDTNETVTFSPTS